MIIYHDILSIFWKTIVLVAFILESTMFDIKTTQIAHNKGQLIKNSTHLRSHLLFDIFFLFCFWLGSWSFLSRLIYNSLFFSSHALFFCQYLNIPSNTQIFNSLSMIKSTSHSFPFYTLLISLFPKSWKARVFDNILQLTIYSYFLGEDHEKKLSTDLLEVVIN